MMNATVKAINTLNSFIIEGFKNPSTVASFTDSAEVSINDHAGYGMEASSQPLFILPQISSGIVTLNSYATNSSKTGETSKISFQIKV
jgi:hypothetical protein